MLYLTSLPTGRLILSPVAYLAWWPAGALPLSSGDLGDPVDHDYSCDPDGPCDPDAPGDPDDPGGPDEPHDPDDPDDPDDPYVPDDP